jgi:hypothetical protein
MFARLRSFLVAGGGALGLTIVLSGVVAAATVLTALTVAPSTSPTAPTADTIATFEDVDGNGVDDDCQVDVVADPVAAASAEALVDTDGDGAISVSEAAHSTRTGGRNCNHGGYVSGVARGECTAEPTDDPEAAPTTCDDEDAAPESDEAAPTADCETAPADETTDEDVPAEDPAPNAHGKAVSEVAKSDAVGGKNCNHGGAVSEAAKKDHAADKAARDAAREARKAQHEAARQAKQHGKQRGG